jgi:hypothetical protein
MYPLQEQRPAVAVLDVRDMYDHVEQRPKGICEDMTLASLDLLTRVRAARSRRLSSSPTGSRRCMRSGSFRAPLADAPALSTGWIARHKPMSRKR